MSNPTSADLKKPDYELTDEGEVVMNKKGKATVLAAFDAVTGHLEFVDERTDRYYRPQIIRAITEDTEGVATENKIKTFGIKGRVQDERKEQEPPKPSPRTPEEHKLAGLLGDKWAPRVDWFFKWRPQEAYVRYGVLLKDGVPVAAHCRRKEKRLGENQETGLVEQTEVVTESEEGMIATRQTHRTFLKNEIVGGVVDEVAGGDDE